MTTDVLLWIYLANATFLINHEIDSAYWKEWKLFRLPGGINGFLLIHFPLLFIVIYGAVLIGRQSPAGLVISLLVSLAGIFAFGIHLFFIRKGRNEFKTAMSLFILAVILVLSMIQALLTVVLLSRT